jgi:hypothetical protein
MVLIARRRKLGHPTFFFDRGAGYPLGDGPLAFGLRALPDAAAAADTHLETTWVARIGVRVQEGTPGRLENPYVPGEFWLYIDNTGSAVAADAPGANSAMHIKVNVTLQDMIRAFGLGH